MHLQQAAHSPISAKSYALAFLNQKLQSTQSITERFDPLGSSPIVLKPQKVQKLGISDLRPIQIGRSPVSTNNSSQVEDILNP